MKAIRGRIEDDEVPDGLVLSMRVKLSLVGLCFFLVLGLIASGSAPHYAEALRGLVQDDSLVMNENQTSDVNQTLDDQATDSEDPGLNPDNFITLLVNDLNPDSVKMIDEDEMAFYDDINASEWNETWVLRVPYPDLGLWDLSDGYLFFNLTPESAKTSFMASEMYGYMARDFPNDVAFPEEFKDWDGIYGFIIPTGLEVKLRISPNNTQEMWWGLKEFSFCQIPEKTYVCISSAGKYRSEEPREITGIDPSEWHTYTILFDQGNVTFLVDRQAVYTLHNTENDILHWDYNSTYGKWTPQWPESLYIDYYSDPIHIYFYNHPLYVDGDPVPITNDHWMQIDYIQLMTKQDVLNHFWNYTSNIFWDISKDLSNQKLIVENATNEAIEFVNTNNINSTFIETINGYHDRWKEEYDEVFSDTNFITDYSGNLWAFRDYDANDLIANINTLLSEYNFSVPQVLPEIPEPTLLPILSLILFPALFRRKTIEMLQQQDIREPLPLKDNKSSNSSSHIANHTTNTVGGSLK